MNVYGYKSKGNMEHFLVMVASSLSQNHPKTTMGYSAHQRHTCQSKIGQISSKPTIKTPKAAQQPG